MKSQITSRINGFLLSEMMLAFSLMTLFLTSALILRTTMEELQEVGVEKLERLEWVATHIASTTLFTRKAYGNDTEEMFLEPITILNSDYISAWGRETCDPKFLVATADTIIMSRAIDLGIGNASTDIEVRNGIAYITADSSSTSLPDVYIVDYSDPEAPFLISSLNTGPGLSALDVAGPYLYLANLGTTNQLQVIDIHDRAQPQIITRYQLPLPQASSTAPRATAIFYSRNRVYLGTEKWEGSEFAVIDILNPANPVYLGGFETNTLINSIYVRGHLAYVAASDSGQMRVLDVSNPGSIIELSQFSPSGWETQQGKILSYFEGSLSLGRTTGGFNIVMNHELFVFSTSSDLVHSRDIPGGVYGITARPPRFYLATHSPGQEFQVWTDDLTQKIFDLPLGFKPQAMSCDHKDVYFATGDRWGIGVIKN